MSKLHSCCSDHGVAKGDLDRRRFLHQAGAAAVSASAIARWADASPPTNKTADSLVKLLHESLTPRQRETICFAWDYEHPKRGLLRTRVENNWKVTKPDINSDFYTADQQALIRSIFERIVHPDWHARIDQQLKDDAGGFGQQQSIALFGQPGEGKFQFLITGRHMTLRCDGNTAEHVAFGGPIFYGHAAQGFHETADHPGNVFWPQAVAANQLFQMLDGKQQNMALVEKGLPRESRVGFRGSEGAFQGIPVPELSSDQRDHLQDVLAKLLEPYREADRTEVRQCLQALGGIDACSLAFYREGDIGGDGVWDNWRLEGPAFVWHFRGAPHVHVWVNVADDASVPLNT